MAVTQEIIKRHFDEKGIKYTMVGDNSDVIRVKYSADNLEGITVLIYEKSEGQSITVRSFDVCKFPEDKKPAMYETCSKMNADYRWVKFYVDERDNTVTCEMDAEVEPSTAGEEAYHCVQRVVGIIDEAYPNFMKAIWS